MPIRKYRGRASKPKVRRTCTEYKRLFDCAKRKGLISLAPPPFNIPSYLSSTDFIAMKTSPGPLIAGSTRTNILKPNSYCYKGHYPQNQGEISNHFPRSLDWLRKYSGCGLRPSGSSSRFDGGSDREMTGMGKCAGESGIPYCAIPEANPDGGCPTGQMIDPAKWTKYDNCMGTQKLMGMIGNKWLIGIVIVAVLWIANKQYKFI